MTEFITCCPAHTHHTLLVWHRLSQYCPSNRTHRPCRVAESQIPRPRRLRGKISTGWYISLLPPCPLWQHKPLFNPHALLCLPFLQPQRMHVFSRTTLFCDVYPGCAHRSRLAVLFYPLDKIYNHSLVSIGAQHPWLLSSVFPCLAPQKREVTNLVWSGLHSCCCLVVHIACWRTTLRGFVKWLDADAGWVMFALVDEREIAVESFGLSRLALA